MFVRYFNFSPHQNISVDVAFLLTAGASAIINIGVVAAVAILSIVFPIGPSAAELALIVIALALYVSDIIINYTDCLIEEYGSS